MSIMSLYNMVNKVNPATFFMLPMLGNGHPDNWPRFRDCFLVPHHFEIINDMPIMVPIDEKSKPTDIYVLLRIGGSNREPYKKLWDIIKRNPNYEVDWDDECDKGYAHVKFSVPDKWKNDFERVTLGKYLDTSEEYRKLLYDTYPKLKDVFDQLFSNS